MFCKDHSSCFRRNADIGTETMEFEVYLKQQLALHPSMQPQDIAKLCYQAAHGAEHLLTDLSAAERYFYAEFDAVDAADGDLYEEISPEIVRVHFAAWKAKGLSPAWLFYMFSHSVCPLRIGEQVLPEYLKRAQDLLQSQAFDAYVAEYIRRGMPAVHHSDTYRAAEKPHYRIVSRFFIDAIPILERIAALPKRESASVVAIDGRAAAGKSTLAAMLSDILGGSLLHTDDFFLPPELRTKERFAAPGGNVHYERFATEVLPYLANSEGFSYRVFDCSAMALCGERTVGASAYRIVEGAYSLHPEFGDYADVTVFMDVEPDTQMARILARNGEKMAEMFRMRWIPMEEAYFAHCGIREKAELILQVQ